MPPKKMPTETENTVEEVPVKQDEENMEAPKPRKKRELSEAQKANFAKLQAANKVRYEARREVKKELGEEEKPKGKNINEEILEDKEAFIQKEITKKKTQVRKVNKQIEEVESDEEAEVQVVKKKKRKTKPRIIVEEDSSDSEQEIVISRRRKNKKKEPIVANVSLPIDIPQETAKEETGPMEKEKPVKEVKEKVPELKEYTHLQILKGLGL